MAKIKANGNETAIGYSSFATAKGVHKVPYRGTTCSLRNAKSGTYLGARNFWMVTRGKAAGAIAKFIKWIRKSSAARKKWSPPGGCRFVSGRRASRRQRLALRPSWRGALQRPPVERALAGTASVVLLLIAGMVVFVFSEAWPSFRENGLAWFGTGERVDTQLEAIFNSPADPNAYEYELRAWPLIWGTILTTGGAVVFGIAFSLLAAIFIVEFAPDGLRRVLEPVVRLLAAVPSVVYGLIGLLVIAPWVAEHLISEERLESVAGVIQLTAPGCSRPRRS